MAKRRKVAGSPKAKGGKSKKKQTRKATKAEREIDALNEMLLGVLQSKAKRKRAKKKALKESGLWADFEMSDDILDVEDDY